jgi:hypothetical protein
MCDDRVSLPFADEENFGDLYMPSWYPVLEVGVLLSSRISLLWVLSRFPLAGSSKDDSTLEVVIYSQPSSSQKIVPALI